MGLVKFWKGMSDAWKRFWKLRLSTFAWGTFVVYMYTGKLGFTSIVAIVQVLGNTGIMLYWRERPNNFWPMRFYTLLWGFGVIVSFTGSVTVTSSMMFFQFVGSCVIMWLLRNKEEHTDGNDVV